jgi:hypothetical protein
LYFLLGLVYAVVTPILLPFIIVFFSLAYLVFRHQVLVVVRVQDMLFMFFHQNIFYFFFCEILHQHVCCHHIKVSQNTSLCS